MNQKLKDALRLLLPRSIAPRRILAGPLRRSIVVTSWHDYPAAILGRTEKPLLDWFTGNVRGGETWLDVGAHYGYTSIALCHLVGPAGRVFAFEPVASTAGSLAQTKALNGFPQLTVVPLALSEAHDLSIRKLPEVRGMADATIRGDGESILTAGLDWLWPRIAPGQRIDGIKIDVQGMEIQVLEGMGDLLREFRPKLAIELHRDVSRQHFIEALAEAGYFHPGTPIEPVPKELAARYLDDRSYAFLPGNP